MRYIVTGGRGVIGSLFARRLVAEGHSVTIIDDGQDPRHLANSFEGPTYITRRLEHMTTSELARVLAECDRVFHAAASTGIPYSAENPLDDWRRNVDGTLSLLEALRVEPRPCVVLSSIKPYDLSGLSESGVSEAFPLAADEIYAASKGAQSLLVQSYARSFDIQAVVFRCSNLWGDACCHGARHGFATWLTIQAALGMEIEVQGGGEQVRDLLFASDLHNAALLAFERISEVSGQIFNIGGGPGNRISVNGLVDALSTLAPIRKRQGPGRRSEDQVAFADNGAISSALGWSPNVGVREGIDRIFSWAAFHRDLLARVYA